MKNLTGILIILAWFVGGFILGLLADVKEEVNTCPAAIGDLIYMDAPYLFEMIEVSGHISAVRGTDLNCEVMVWTEEFGQGPEWGHNTAVNYGVRP